MDGEDGSGRACSELLSESPQLDSSPPCRWFYFSAAKSMIHSEDRV